jgi:hypothetical protein
VRRSRVKAGALLAFLLVLVAAWWLGRDDGSPGTAPIDDPAPAAPPPPVETAATPAFAQEPAEEPLAVATIRVLDAKHGDPAKESLLEAEAIAGPPGPELAVEETGPGVWTLKGPRGSVVRLVATSAGFVPAERWMLLGPRPEMRIHLAPVGTVAIRVLAAKDGSPIPGARVHVEGEPILFRGRNAARSWSGRTDDRGLVDCGEAGPARRLRVVVLADGFLSLSEHVVAAPEGVVLLLRNAETAVIRAVDDRGSPVPDAVVLPLGLDGIPLVPPELAPATGPDGTAAVASPAAYVTSPGRSPRFLARLRAGQVNTAQLDPASSGGVSLADEAGAPLGGVALRLAPLEALLRERDAPGIPLAHALPDVLATTDARGRVSIDPLPADTAWAACIGGAGEFPAHVRRFESRDLVRWPEIRVPEGFPVSLAVSTPRGRPFARAEVLLYPPAAFDEPRGIADAALRRAAPVLTGEDGTARVLVPAGLGFRPAVLAGPLLWETPGPRPAGEVLRANFRSPGLLRVRAIDASGDPIAAALFRLRPAPGESGLPSALRDRMTQEAVAGPDGSAAFEVPAGTPLQVTATATCALDAAERILSPVEGEADAEFVLSPARTAWIAIEGPDGARLASVPVAVSFDGLRAPWLVRGVTGSNGVLALSLPTPGEAPSPAARAVFAAGSPPWAWAEVPLGSLADGGRVRVSPNPADFVRFVVAEDRLWPAGTPFRWSYDERTQGTSLEGEGRIGEQVAIFVKGARSLPSVRLPGALPAFPEEDRRRQSEIKIEVFRDSSIPRERRSEEAERRLAELAQAGMRLPLAPRILHNETGAWSRARVVDSRTKESLVTAPLPPGALVRVLVPEKGDCKVTWEPPGSGSR